MTTHDLQPQANKQFSKRPFYEIYLLRFFIGTRYEIYHYAKSYFNLDIRLEVKLTISTFIKRLGFFLFTNLIFFDYLL